MRVRPEGANVMPRLIGEDLIACGGDHIRAMSFTRIEFPRDVPKPALPVCDWVYFATPSKAGWDKTRAVVSDFRMIVRPVYENSEHRDKPKPIANGKNIRQGE